MRTGFCERFRYAKSDQLGLRRVSKVAVDTERVANRQKCARKPSFFEIVHQFRLSYLAEEMAEMEYVVSAVVSGHPENGNALTSFDGRSECSGPGIGGYMKSGHVGVILASKTLGEYADIPCRLIDDVRHLPPSMTVCVMPARHQ
jgi:hypothetical protein